MQQTFQIHFMAKFLEKRHGLSPHIWGKKFTDLFNPIQDGVLFAPHPLPVFPLQLLQTYELAPKTFWLFATLL